MCVSIIRDRQSSHAHSCFVPLIPCSANHLYKCSICQWECSADGPAPPKAGSFPPQGQYMQVRSRS